MLHCQIASNKSNITLIPKLDKDTTEKENYRQISPIDIHVKIFSKIICWLNLRKHKKIINHDQIGFISVLPGSFNVYKSINLVYYINRFKGRKRMIILIDYKRLLTVQYHFMIEKSWRNLKRRNISQPSSVYWEPIFIYVSVCFWVSAYMYL